MITRRDLGRRVVVRKIVGERDGRPVFSDILGELVSFDEDHLTVRDKRGNDEWIPRTLVAAAKLIPSRPTSHRDIVALERVAAAGWPAPDTDRLGAWVLRAAGGWTSRANSVLPLGDPGVGVGQALDRVHTWYTARDLKPRFAVPLPAFRSLDRELADRGWQPTHRVLVQTASLPELLAAVPPRDDLPPVRVTRRPDQDWLRVVDSRKGGPPEVAVRVLTGARLPAFASVSESGELLAIGRGVVDEGWLGLSLMEVVPGARRRGLARHVVAALAHWGAEHRAGRAYLQVEEDNEAALALYAGLGFSTHHGFLNRSAPAT
ncbi:MAG TPA: GNAT family N-acetyltransferase [Micromonosporaceae bacterium]